MINDHQCSTTGGFFPFRLALDAIGQVQERPLSTVNPVAG
jgi:hypothetical protein